MVGRWGKPNKTQPPYQIGQLGWVVKIDLLGQHVDLLAVERLEPHQLAQCLDDLLAMCANRRVVLIVGLLFQICAAHVSYKPALRARTWHTFHSDSQASRVRHGARGHDASNAAQNDLHHLGGAHRHQIDNGAKQSDGVQLVKRRDGRYAGQRRLGFAARQEQAHGAFALVGLLLQVRREALVLHNGGRQRPRKERLAP